MTVEDEDEDDTDGEHSKELADDDDAITERRTAIEHALQKKRNIIGSEREGGGGDTANGRNSILYELEGWRNAAEAAPSSISTTAPYLSLRSDEVNGLAFVYVDHAFWKGSHDS